MSDTENKKQELEQYSSDLGKKIGFLISVLNFSNDTRQAIIDLLPTLSDEQVYQFVDLLETLYLQAATSNQDTELAEALAVIAKGHTEAVNKAQDTLLAGLDDLASDVK